MINELEYITEGGGVKSALAADKNMMKRNAWHLKSIDGNGLPPVSALGSASFGVAGKSYAGLSVGGREIEAELYADAFSAAGLQQMTRDAARVVSPDNGALGVLRLRNAAGEWFRIAAKCVDFAEVERKRRSSLFSAVFDCPYSYFESDTLNVKQLFAMEGGKEYIAGEGLQRPYTFGDASGGAGVQTVDVFNAGDVAAPCVLRLFGTGLQRVELSNVTTGASVIVEGMSASGLIVSTDENNLSARFDDGTDASAYVSLFSDLSDFRLAPGRNVIRVDMDSTAATVAGTQIEWRGRYSLCL